MVFVLVLVAAPVVGVVVGGVVVEGVAFRCLSLFVSWPFVVVVGFVGCVAFVGVVFVKVLLVFLELCLFRLV